MRNTERIPLHILLICLAVIFSWKRPCAHAAPVNDDFAAPTQISGLSGTVPATNVDATAEVGEPNHGDSTSGAHSSIWFIWTAPADGIYLFTTYGSSFDTTLSVYTGNSVDALVKQAENDDVESLVQSRAAFSAVTGTSYYIAVDGYSIDDIIAEQGDVVLNWQETEGLSNDDFSSAISITGASGHQSGFNFTATTEPDEPNHGDGAITAHSSVWYTWTAPSTGPAIFNTYGSDFDTVLAAYQGSEVDNLFAEAKNDDAGWDNYKSRIAFIAESGTHYRIAVDGFNRYEQGNVFLGWIQLPSITNDSFESPSIIAEMDSTVTTTNFEATSQNGEPNHTGDIAATAYSSIWFSWTAPFTGQVIFDTFGSDFDTVLAAYSGSELGSLVVLAQNDDVTDLHQSRIRFQAVTGITYHIAVDGYDAEEQGLVLLNISKPFCWSAFYPAIFNRSGEKQQ